MKVTDFSALIARLEKETRPDRELDGMIYGAVNSLVRNTGTFMLDICGDEVFQFEHPTDRHPSGPAALYVKGYKIPEYTASIDAAVTLVPDGMQWDLTGKRWGSFATVWSADNTCPPDRHQLRGETPAIALCIAALRARESQSVSLRG